MMKMKTLGWSGLAVIVAFFSAGAQAAREGGGAWDFEGKINQQAATALILDAAVAFTASNACDAKKIATVVELVVQSSDGPQILQAVTNAARAELSSAQQQCLSAAINLLETK